MIRRWAALFALLLAAACTTPPAPAPVETGLLTIGEPLEAIITGPAGEQQWSFQAEIGTSIDATFTAAEPLPGIVLSAPTGGVLFSVPAGSTEIETAQSSIVLPVDGIYTITVLQPAAAATAYRLLITLGTAQPTPSPPAAPTLPPTLEDSSPSPAATATITLETPQGSSQLQPYTPVQSSIDAPGESDRYTVFGAAGDIITLGMYTSAEGGITPLLTIYTPAGEVLATTENGGSASTALIWGITLPVTGAYVVFAEAINEAQTGAYTIAFGSGYAIQNNTQPAPIPENVYTGAITIPASRDVWPLTLNLGDIISAAVVVDDDGTLDPVLSLIGPEGSILYQDDNGGGGRSAALRNIVIPQNGQFWLAVSPAAPDAATGSYTLLWRYEAQAGSAPD